MKKLLLILLCLPLIGFGQINKPEAPLRKENQTFIEWYNSFEYNKFVNQASIYINQNESAIQAQLLVERLRNIDDIYAILKYEQDNINELNNLKKHLVVKKYKNNEPLPTMLSEAVEVKKAWENDDYWIKRSDFAYKVLEDLKEDFCNHKNCSFVIDEYEPFDEVRTLRVGGNIIADGQGLYKALPTQLAYGTIIINSDNLIKLQDENGYEVNITNEEFVALPNLTFTAHTYNMMDGWNGDTKNNYFSQELKAAINKIAIDFSPNNILVFKLKDRTSINATIISAKFNKDEKLYWNVNMHISIGDLIKFSQSEIVGTRLLDQDNNTIRTWIYPQKPRFKSISKLKTKLNATCLLNEIGSTFNMRISELSIRNVVNKDQKKYFINGTDIRKIDTYSINEMIDIFLLDCKLNGIKINDNQNIDATFQSIDGITLGLAYEMNNDAKIKIIIDPILWRNSSIQKKWYILYHELGHDVLNLEHGQGGKMMFNFADREYTWAEFFNDKKNMFKYVSKDKNHAMDVQSEYKPVIKKDKIEKNTIRSGFDQKQFDLAYNDYRYFNDGSREDFVAELESREDFFNVYYKNHTQFNNYKGSKNDFINLLGLKPLW